MQGRFAVLTELTAIPVSLVSSFAAIIVSVFALYNSLRVDVSNAYLVDVTHEINDDYSEIGFQNFGNSTTKIESIYFEYGMQLAEQNRLQYRAKFSPIEPTFVNPSEFVSMRLDEMTISSRDDVSFSENEIEKLAGNSSSMMEAESRDCRLYVVYSPSSKIYQELASRDEWVSCSKANKLVTTYFNEFNLGK